MVQPLNTTWDYKEHVTQETLATVCSWLSILLTTFLQSFLDSWTHHSRPALSAVFISPLSTRLYLIIQMSLSLLLFSDFAPQPKYILAPLTPTLFFFINNNYNYLIILQLECKVQKSFKVCIVFHCKFNF